MDIIFHGKYQLDEAVKTLAGVLHLFKKHYNITQFREMYLILTLMDDQGEDLDLVDSNTAQVYRIFEVYKKGHEVTKRQNRPTLQLVVDNTRN